MSGRNKLSRLKKLENDIRTTVWFDEVLRVSGAKNAHQLSSMAKWGDERKWSDYASCRHSPNETTREKTDNRFPGTIEFYESGPKNSYLFTAMCCTADEIFEFSDDRNGVFWWLNTIMADSGLKQTDNKALWAVILQLENQLFSRTSIQTVQEHYKEFPPLRFLGGCLLILRFTMERDKYHVNSFVPQVVEMVIDCLEYQPIYQELNRYRINQLLREWLHQSLLTWSRYSRRGRIFSLIDFPDSNSFVENPRLFGQKVMEGEDKAQDIPPDYVVQDFVKLLKPKKRLKST